MLYLDTSALVKLVVTEPETAALRRLIKSIDPADLVTSALSRTELLRAAQRRDTRTVDRAHKILDGVAQITLTQALLDAAGTLPPPTLRTLDAIHLATALELGADLEAFIAYDMRLLDAASSHPQIATLSPS